MFDTKYVAGSDALAGLWGVRVDAIDLAVKNPPCLHAVDNINSSDRRAGPGPHALPPVGRTWGVEIASPIAGAAAGG
jgi:hypothetical protein